MNKRQKMVFNASPIDDLLARADQPETEIVVLTPPEPIYNEKPKKRVTTTPKNEDSRFLDNMELRLSSNKTSTSYNISDPLLLALDQACLELKATGAKRSSTGRKVTRGHLIESALVYALGELQQRGLDSPFAHLLLKS